MKEDSWLSRWGPRWQEVRALQADRRSRYATLLRHRKAAEKGHPDSEYRLAVGHAAGLGVKLDEAEALVWLRRAADHSHKRAQKNLARAYEQGRFGLKPDPEQAKHWYDKAASGS